MYSDTETSKTYKEINSDNYLSNCYNHLTKIKAIHFIFILIEILLNTFHELELFICGYILDFDKEQNFDLILIVIKKCDKIQSKFKLIIIILFIFLFDSLYIILKKKKIKIRHIRISIIVNILEIIIYRTFTLFFLEFFQRLEKEIFLFGCLFLIPHLYLIWENFLYNHLYYFVPEFIHYPYDEFSSLYDIILLINKILLSFTGNTNNFLFGYFCFIILFLFQILFSLFFIYQLINNSYLFMRNSFLNLSRISFYFSKTMILCIAFLFGKNEIMNVLFLIISISMLFIFMVYMFFIYNPFSHVKIRRDTPLENMFFYLYILSEKNNFNFILENQVKKHHDKCGICDLCKKYIKYMERAKIKIEYSDEEKEKFINETNTQNNDENKLIDLFELMYDNKNKYFNLIKKLILDTKKRKKDCSNNNSYYFINLSYLIYSDYTKKKKTLSLNERIILEKLNKEKYSNTDNEELKINQIFLCNHFMALSKKILAQLKDILNSEININRAKKLIDLSHILKELKSRQYKESLFSHKMENISNSKHLILICTIIYEEIYNTTLNNSQLPLRDNTQPLEDIFYNNHNKINNLISFSVDLANNTCKIIKAGKDLYSYINQNFFDLFPLDFKNYQINLFMLSIFENFDIEKYKEIEDTKKVKFSSKIKKENIRTSNIKNEYIEINLIICQKISSKIYYKLINLKISPIVNHNISNCILFDGIYYLHKNILITLQDFEENVNAIEKLISVSEPELDKNIEIYSIPFKKYVSFQNSQGFQIQKLSSFNIEIKYFNLYTLIIKKEKETKVFEKNTNRKKKSENNEDFQSNIKENIKGHLIEENASVASQTTGSSFSGLMSNLGMKNNYKNNIFEYDRFNKIRRINILAILIALIFLLMEYILLRKSKIDIYNNNVIMIEYQEFYKLYFQLFTSILTQACIIKDGKCTKIYKTFAEDYYSKFPNEHFNFERLVVLQNEVLVEKMMERKSYLINIHKFLGNKKYNELFGKNIKFSRITQNIINQKNYINLTFVDLKFSEAILSLCNSFKILVENTDIPLTFLSGLNDPFNNLNSLGNNDFLNEYQKNFYELLLNYKNYYEKFNTINNNLSKIISSEFKSIKIVIYIYLTLDLILFIIACSLMYAYSLSFEFILIKIINYINMTINIKSDEFNFKEIFLKKIEKLESILQFYNSDPIKSINNLNLIYNKYQQFINAKNKNNSSEMNKKKNKKLEEDKKSQLDSVPKNQRLITRKDVKFLGLTFKFTFLYYFNLFIVLIIYILLIFLWKDYFSKESNLINLFQKDIAVENTLYRAINSYDLMIFHNLTISDLSHLFLFDEKQIKNEKDLLINFYENVLFSFNSKKEQNKVGEMMDDLEDFDDFTCKKLYELSFEEIEEIENMVKKRNYNDIENIVSNLVLICEHTRIDETKDFKTVFERHVHFVINGILSVNDHSLNGLLDHITKDKTLSRISLFFTNIIIFLLEINFTKPKNGAIKKLIKKLTFLINLSEIIYLIYDIFGIIIFVFVYIYCVNRLCNQIFLLKNVFKIFEIHD